MTRRTIGAVISPSNTANYKYDGLGRRVEKEVITDTTTVTKYVYDNEDILLELDGSNAIVARYTHGPSIDEPLIMEKASASFYYHADGLGSITELTNQSGTVVQRYTYSSFGKIETQFDPNFAQPYTFTSRELDVESGLYYYRARSYDSTNGRFLQQDPIGFAGGVNFYTYVGNSPTTFIDAWGLAKHDPASPYCQDLLKKINNIRKDIQKRYRELEENPLDLPEYIGPGERLRDTRSGHRLLIELAWQNLRELEKKYDDECRDDKEKCDDKLRQAAAAAAAAGAAYATYRIIRLLPSLVFPPLWPTIPANVVVP